MRNKLARWAWKRLVRPRVAGIICRNEGGSDVYTPDEVWVVLRGHGKR